MLETLPFHSPISAGMQEGRERMQDCLFGVDNPSLDMWPYFPSVPSLYISIILWINTLTLNRKAGESSSVVN